MISRSNRKNKKLVVNLNGKFIHFGDRRYEDFTIHKNEKRRLRYLKRHYNILDESGNRVINDPYSPSYWSARVLWNYSPKRDDPKINN